MLRIRIYRARMALFGSALAALATSNATPATACVHGFFCTPGSATGTPVGSTAVFFQSLGQTAQATSQVGLTGIQQQIWSIEDRLQCSTDDKNRTIEAGIACKRRQQVMPKPPAFAEEGPADPVIEFGLRSARLQQQSARPPGADSG